MISLQIFLMVICCRLQQLCNYLEFFKQDLNSIRIQCFRMNLVQASLHSIKPVLHVLMSGVISLPGSHQIFILTSPGKVKNRNFEDLFTLKLEQKCLQFWRQNMKKSFAFKLLNQNLSWNSWFHMIFTSQLDDFFQQLCSLHDLGIMFKGGQTYTTIFVQQPFNVSLLDLPFDSW